MSRALWKSNKLLPAILVFIICSIFLLTEKNLTADAYLAEDRIYYGADSYNINYKDEIINAQGNAYFRKEGLSVKASKIVIYYAEDEKRALFYDRVQLEDSETGYVLHGDYGEGYFNDEVYILTGNVNLIDGERRIQGQRAETEGLDFISITGNVIYTDENLTITAQRLDLWKEDRAQFQNDVHAVFTDMGDEAFCRRLTIFLDTENQEFRDDVLLIQRKSSSENADPFIIKAELVTYEKETDFYLFMERVFATDGRYSLRGALVKYFRDSEILESMGNTIINDGDRTLYSDRILLDVSNNDISFIGSIQGVFDAE
jgi:lipopolysaccharide assembly outer membrane protein LptD (OstA)